MTTTTTPLGFTSTIIAQIYTSRQLDLLHLSIINLFDMMKESEIDLVLSQDKKTAKQKKLFIQKVIDSVEGPELKQELQKELDAGNVDFFYEKYLKDFLTSLQTEAERMISVKLQVAIEFKKTDLQDVAIQLTKTLGRPVVIDITVDHSLIGGAIVQYGNYISDYSLKSRFERFREHWEKAVVEKA